MNKFKWFRCNWCGYEMMYTARVQQCDRCHKGGYFNIRSDADGEVPKQDEIRALRDLHYKG